ncbi:MAG: N-6 DNA methylase [Euryarchaeota archaeon]|nr:N-6 DNA methylase [Euryarchaeota archaeon]
MVDKEQAKERVRALVEKFEKGKGHYQSPNYNEAQARQEFISPLFEALGWDIRNARGLPPQDQEVLVEWGETQGRPDYAFRIGGKTKFFVEAKAPHVSLDNLQHIHKAKSYAWSSKETYFAVLTDFEDILLFDASRKPDINNPRQGMLWKLSCNEYIDKFDDLWDLSRDSVAGGRLDTLLLSKPKARDQVDEAFLDDLQKWREELAKSLYRDHPKAFQNNPRLLNEVVQRMLDRLVFIRIAEDRGVLEPDRLKRVADIYRTSEKSITGPLHALFKGVNAKLNGEIFKSPHAVEDYEFDSGLLQKIIESLHWPDCPYHFGIIPVELLGTIYERYLGNTIRLTPQRVKVEEKPEVRKAGGVFYTPRYIVDYIVENTVGKLIEGKSPDEISKLRILDPACGSGSFLLGAYQKLINHHIRWYQTHPQEAPGRLILNGPGSPPRLTIEEKGRILKNNIHGVDIDPQAVEITMMSLYIKALEGERTPPGGREVLPRLAENIKCGNSLIGTDIYDTPGRTFTEEEKARINPFDWKSKAGFGEILERGGFDAVVGNPPYVRQESLSDFKEYFRTHYKAFNATADLYAYFLEKGVRLLKEGGLFSMIVSSSLMYTTYAEELRRVLKESAAIFRVVDFGGLSVFENAKDTYVCIPLIAKDAQPKRIEACKVESFDFNDLNSFVASNHFSIPQERLTPEVWSLKSDAVAAVFEKIKRVGKPLLY